MKKMVIYFGLMMAFATAAFAYELNKENAKVKRNGDVVYYEKIKDYKPSYMDIVKQDYVKFVIRKGYTVEQLVDYKYERLESIRKSYYYSMKRAENLDPNEVNSTFIKCLIEIQKKAGIEESPEDYVRNSWLKRAKEAITWGVTRLPCVTEENFLTLTKEEMLDKMNAFIEACKE